jgi:hypothetical protein
MRQMNFYLIRLAKSSPGEILHQIRELIFIKKLKIAPGWYLIKLKEDFQKTFYTSTGIKLPETDNQNSTNHPCCLTEHDQSLFACPLFSPKVMFNFV